MTRMNNKKVSQFLNKGSFTSTDSLTGISGGVNYNFSYSTLYNALSGIGSISSLGGGTAVLNQPAAGISQIRTITAEKGTTVGLNAYNGVVVGNSFQQSTGGEALIPDLGASTYTVKTIKATSPLEVTSDDDSITIGFNDSPLAQTNTVIVSDITDFPTPVSGVITLEDDTNYILVQAVTTSNRFQLGTNNSITSNNPFTPFFTFMGSGSFFTGSDVSFIISNIALLCFSEKIFDLTSSDGSHTFGVENLTIGVCDECGTINNFRSFNVDNIGVFSCNQGFTFTGTDQQALSANKVRFESGNSSFVGFDLTNSIHQTLNISTAIFMMVDGGVGISGLADSANISADYVATVTNSEFIGSSTPLSGIDHKDGRFEFAGNSGVQDSISDALITITGNATETVISAASSDGSNAVKMAGTWTDVDLSRFSSDGTGRLTYTREKTEKLPIDVTISILAAAGGDKQVAAYLAINGVIIEATGMQETASSTKAGVSVIIYQHEFETGDYVEIFLENQTSTDNLIGQRAVSRIN